MICDCGSATCTQCAKGEGVEGAEEWAEGKVVSLRVKRDERVGFGGWMGWM